MFGPNIEILSGRHVIFMDAGNRDATDCAIGLFKNTAATCIEMPIDEHDRLIAYVLGLSHLLNIAFFTALKNSGEQAGKLKNISSTTFDAQLEVAHKIANENPHLYFEIQKLNQYRQDAGDALKNAIEEILNAIGQDSDDAFVRIMQEGRSYLETHHSLKK
jgi:chorismate mutase/prephenate dehydrogenase